MTGFQWVHPRVESWPLPARVPARSGKHASTFIAKWSLRRWFYVARHRS
jgi:hypothetical protein